MKITIGIVDDEQLFLKSLSILISRLPGFEVVLDALTGRDILEKLERNNAKPDIMLIDVRMKGMNGIEATREIAARYPAIKLVALSSQDDDATVIQMIRSGCCAFLFKGIHPTELEKALLEVWEKGYYNADACNLNYRRLILHEQKMKANQLTDRETQFVRLACSDLTYKQIAAEMYLSERTIDGYRESVFEKMQVHSRVGMALEAIRTGIVSI